MLARTPHHRETAAAHLSRPVVRGLVIRGPDGLADFLPILIVVFESLWCKMMHY